MYGTVLPPYKCTQAHGGQMRALDPLEVVLWMVLPTVLVLRTEPWSCVRAASPLNC